jgi:hypothetical protein
MQNTLRQILFYMYIRILYTYYQLRNMLIPPPPPPPIILDPVEEYTKPRKHRLLLTYESDVNMNTNINPAIYDRKQLSVLLKDESNELERLWKTRILYEATPRGPVIMYYDIFKQGFAYYSDQSGIPYSILNAVAMKYVVTFFCRDLFFDEITITTEKLSPLVKVFNEEEKKVKTKTTLEKEGQPFAKLRNYKTEQPHNKTGNKEKDDANEKEKENERPKLKNKFISLGKMYNFSIVQKAPKNKKLPNKPTSFDGMFSYKDFKNRQNKRT